MGLIGLVRGSSNFLRKCVTCMVQSRGLAREHVAANCFQERQAKRKGNCHSQTVNKSVVGKAVQIDCEQIDCWEGSLPSPSMLGRVLWCGLLTCQVWAATLDCVWGA